MSDSKLRSGTQASGFNKPHSRIGIAAPAQGGRDAKAQRLAQGYMQDKPGSDLKIT